MVWKLCDAFARMAGACVSWRADYPTSSPVGVCGNDHRRYNPHTLLEGSLMGRILSHTTI
jgi:hypothetical protein